LATDSLFAFELGISPNHCIAKTILKISTNYANNHVATNHLYINE